MQGISKRYPGVQALDGVDIVLDRGEIHALVGKNGAGKSTLIKVLGGVTVPDAGTVEIDGDPVTLGDPHAAIESGIAIVHQELSLIPHLSVAENVFLGRSASNGRRSVIVDRADIVAATRRVLARLDSAIDPMSIVGQLSVAQQQMVEIAKALARNPKVLVLDEPTSALADGDADRLLDVLRALASAGVGIIYISHRLAEVQQLASRMTVLRDGTTVAEVSMDDVDQNRIVHLMLGEALGRTALRDEPSARREAVVLRVENLTRGHVVRDVSFDLHEGEVLGIAGLVGAGRTELARLIFGCDRADSGRISVNGRRIARPDPRRMIRHGLGFLPEDRKHQGLVLGLSVRENLVLTVLDRVSTAGIVSRKRESRTVHGLVADLQIACSSAEVLAGTLSGGNQQKIVVGKWLATHPKVLILDEPTRGIDVQAKAQIFAILNRLANEGVAILFISSELEEVMLVSHRILTMASGRLVAETRREHAELADILLAATG